MSGNPWRKSRGPSLPWWALFAGLSGALIVQAACNALFR